MIDLRGGSYNIGSCSVNSAKIFHIFSSSYQLEDIQRNIPIKKWYPCQDSTGKTLSVVFCTQVSLNNCRQISKWIYSFKKLFKILKRANLICSLAMWSSRQIDNFSEYCQIVRYILVIQVFWCMILCLFFLLNRVFKKKRWEYFSLIRNFQCWIINNIFQDYWFALTPCYFHYKNLSCNG